MKARILFFDDEPETNQRLKALLEKNGYVVSTPQNYEEALHEINFNKADLIIHTAHRTKTYWQLCDRIFAEYAEFPSIHFATGPAAEEYQKTLKGLFHYKLRPLIPERDFLKRVRKLIFLGRLSRENQALKKAMALHKRADKLFQSHDPIHLGKQIVEFFGTEFKASNAVFLAPGAYGFYLQEMWKVSALNNREVEDQLKRHSIISFSPCDEPTLSHLFGNLMAHLPREWELKKDRTVVSLVSGSRDQYCLIPLIGPQSGRILGHILLINPLMLGDSGLERSMGHILGVMCRHLEQVIAFSGTKNLNYIDDLTELYNQRYLKMVLDKEISRSTRSNTSFSVLFMDIDHFKKVNDTQGHVVGSKVLVELSKILAESIRAMDYGFRYGGDEFIVLLVGTGSEQAYEVAERIRKKVESTEFDIYGPPIRVTLSIGIATFPDHAKSREQIIELADRAMYCGKNKSRNVVFVAS